MTFFIKQRLNMDNSTYVPKESETFPYEFSLYSSQKYKCLLKLQG